MSLRDWFLTPAPADHPEHADERDATLAHRAAPDTRSARHSAGTWAPPVNAAPSGAVLAGAVSARVDAADAGSARVVSADAVSARVVSADAVSARVVSADAVSASVVSADAVSADTATAAIPPAVVIGRAGEAEPVAAGVALALRGRAPAAAVIVVAAHAEPNAEGGTRAARRLAARFDAHGFGVAARGRLAWAYTTPEAARRAVRIGGEGAVLAITVPLEPDLERAIGGAGLAIVVARDERGPLAQLAAGSLTCPTVTTRPLPRGAARALARHGLRAPAELHALLSEQLAHICHKRA